MSFARVEVRFQHHARALADASHSPNGRLCQVLPFVYQAAARKDFAELSCGALFPARKFFTQCSCRNLLDCNECDSHHNRCDEHHRR